MEESDEFTFALSGAPTASETGTRSPLSALPLIQMLVSAIPNERMEMISRNARGFIYLVSVTAVAFARTSISEGLGELIARAPENDWASRTLVERAKQFAAEFRSALSNLNE